MAKPTLAYRLGYSWGLKHARQASEGEASLTGFRLACALSDAAAADYRVSAHRFARHWRRGTADAARETMGGRA